jgi:hypothetical protein
MNDWVWRAIARELSREKEVASPAAPPDGEKEDGEA